MSGRALRNRGGGKRKAGGQRPGVQRPVLLGRVFSVGVEIDKILDNVASGCREPKGEECRNSCAERERIETPRRAPIFDLKKAAWRSSVTDLVSAVGDPWPSIRSRAIIRTESRAAARPT